MDKNSSVYDILIIGGGPAGMTAAIKAKTYNPDLSVLILEKNDVLGKKLKATGNGRCNMTNVNAPNYLETLKFFNELSVLPREEEGRIYPYSEDGKDVVNALRERVYDLGITVMTHANVIKIHLENEIFKVITEEKEISGKQLLIATGGKAAPVYGSTGDGYSFAKNFGHSITPLVPILTSVEVKGDTAFLKGIRSKGILTLKKYEEETFKEFGEIQFTDYGVSGICVFNGTRFMKFMGKEGLSPYTMYFDFAPNTDMVTYIDERIDNAIKISSDEKVNSLLRGVVKGKLSERIVEIAGIKSDRLIRTLSEKEVLKVCECVHGYELKPKGIKGWKMAQCTSGGIRNEEIDEETLESKIQKNLYFAGEILDYDGPCGGFNLDNAWHSGIAAGISMSR